MMDKVSRISTLLEKEAKVKDEAIEDTLEDLINYTAILKSYLKQKKFMNPTLNSFIQDMNKDTKMNIPLRSIEL